MEPLAAANANAIVRPAGGANEVSSVLREGRVLTGEVIARLDGGTLLLGIGGQQVPAETGVDLEPGDRFLATVERKDGELTLRLTPAQRASADPSLLQAFRALLVEDKPLGALLHDLVAALRASGASQGGSAIDALRAGVEAQAFRPDMDGAALRALLTRGGVAYEAALLAAAGEAGLDGFDSALHDLALQVRGALESAGAGGLVDLAELERALASALRGLGGRTVAGPLTSDLAAHLVREAEHALATALRMGSPGGARLAAGIESGALRAFPLGAHGALLRALLNVPGILGPSPLATSLSQLAYAGLDGDLRGRIALELHDLPEAVRDAASRVLAGLDLERLLNGARRDFGEPFHYSVPVPDGDGWSTAHLFVHGRDAHGGSSGGGAAPDTDAEDSYHVVIGIDLTNLGPVRADLLLRRERIAVRLRVARPDVAQRLRALAPQLEALLASEGQSVLLSILEARPEEIDVEELSHDIRYLREHHLMDVRG